ncbi:MAG: hypothetical protein WCS17_14020 [Prevotella sp.]
MVLGHSTTLYVADRDGIVMRLYTYSGVWHIVGVLGHLQDTGFPMPSHLHEKVPRNAPFLKVVKLYHFTQRMRYRQSSCKWGQIMDGCRMYPYAGGGGSCGLWFYV